MDTSVTISIGGLIAMAGLLIAWVNWFNKNLDGKLKGKFAEHQLGCNEKLHDKIDKVKDDISGDIKELTKHVMKMNGDK
jgi:hypothetical protein